ncbi:MULTISPECIES: hypothetical protein [unclassified Streptomyces]|uniref:DUF7144 family membrane protein n=1 Tax=unclassified Streptomyces TaxID=2593676 RepID=UPI0011E73279|nr:hypothetical protein [Streptomyces sp. sk2.1]TXS70472.1 hypothetical protein EAO76_23310 [Streptomyces sp. sk2.1]
MASTGHAPGAVPSATSSHQPFRFGWTAFAAVLMIFGGAMTIFEGIAAIAKDDVFVVARDYLFRFNLTGWGWIHLILGIVILIAGCALFTGAAWARVVGIVIAGLSGLANFLWLPYYPFWALVLIAINVFIIWALCADPYKERVT